MTTKFNPEPTIYEAAMALAYGDLSPAGLAETFGARTIRQIHNGQDPYVAARLAGSFAQQVLAQRGVVIGRITPDCPWGIN